MAHPSALVRRLAFGLAVGLATGVVHAHGGGLNAEGCHTQRATGDYHCHRGASVPPPASALRPQGAPAFAAMPAAGRAAPFRNCAEARAAGAAPVLRGSPGYGPHLDRDNDGVACEPYRGR